MTEQEAISEIRENKYTGNCYLEAQNAKLRAALKSTTDAYEAILQEQFWTTTDGHPPSWHALIVNNRALLETEA